MVSCLLEATRNLSRILEMPAPRGVGNQAETLEPVNIAHNTCCGCCIPSPTLTSCFYCSGSNAQRKRGRGELSSSDLTNRLLRNLKVVRFVPGKIRGRRSAVVVSERLLCDLVALHDAADKDIDWDRRWSDP